MRRDKQLSQIYQQTKLSEIINYMRRENQLKRYEQLDFREKQLNKKVLATKLPGTIMSGEWRSNLIQRYEQLNCRGDAT
jgi:hypothetical protein